MCIDVWPCARAQAHTHTNTHTQSSITQGLIVIEKQRDSSKYKYYFFFFMLWKSAARICDCTVICLNDVCWICIRLHVSNCVCVCVCTQFCFIHELIFLVSTCEDRSMRVKRCNYGKLVDIQIVKLIWGLSGWVHWKCKKYFQNLTGTGHLLQYFKWNYLLGLKNCSCSRRYKDGE